MALAASSSAASGLPTRSERPTTTASAPSSATSWRRSSSITPAGVHGRSPGRPLASRPAETGVRPSTSLAGRSARSAPPPSTCGGVGSWSRMPETRGSSLSSLQQPLDLLVRGVVRAAGGRSRRCRPRRRPAACRRRRPREAGSSPTSTVASPGCAAARLDPRGDLRADLVADLLRDRLAVDDLGRHCGGQAIDARRERRRRQVSAADRRRAAGRARGRWSRRRAARCRPRRPVWPNAQARLTSANAIACSIPCARRRRTASRSPAPTGPRSPARRARSSAPSSQAASRPRAAAPSPPRRRRARPARARGGRGGRRSRPTIGRDDRLQRRGDEEAGGDRRRAGAELVQPQRRRAR